MVRDWTLDRRDAYPTMKEKAIFLTKMVTFESRQEAVEPFHGLIYDIYTSPALRRSELTTCLDICFLVGCRAKDVTIQENSIGLLDISVPIFLALHTGGKGWCPDPVHHKYIAKKWTKDSANTHPEYSKDIQNFPSQFN
jgi:hypothetical protein